MCIKILAIFSILHWTKSVTWQIDSGTVMLYDVRGNWLNRSEIRNWIHEKTMDVAARTTVGCNI